jgi:hypothetical protein
MKGWLEEGNSSSGSIDPSALSDFLDNVNNMIQDMIDNSTSLVSESGDQWAVATASPIIAMRQMHRRRKKTVTP